MVLLKLDQVGSAIRQLNLPITERFNMSVFTCDGGTREKACINEVNVGYANPSLVLCAECNGGSDAFNCVDSGNYSCDCAACGPQPWSELTDYNCCSSDKPINNPPDCTYQEDTEGDDIPF